TSWSIIFCGSSAESRSELMFARTSVEMRPKMDCLTMVFLSMVPASTNGGQKRPPPERPREPELREPPKLDGRKPRLPPPRLPPEEPQLLERDPPQPPEERPEPPEDR